MKRKVKVLVIVLFSLMISGSVFAEGYLVTSDLWIRAVINTVEKGPIDAVWQKGGEDITSAGDRVIWGHFYASPSDVTWGSQNNPDLFVKIWFDHGGRLDVNFFHVSVPDIEVYSDYPHDGTPDEHGTTTMSRRYIRQYYENGLSYSDENYEDGNPPSGYSPTSNPSGYSTINDLRIGSIINTVEKGPIDGLWQLGGQDITARGDQVVWGHFYASPTDVTWGSENNPDLFVKIWFDVSGRVDVNYFHVSVPDIEVYSDLPSDATYDQKGTTIMDNRYIRHEYWIGTDASIVGSWGTCFYPDGIENEGEQEYISLTFYPNGYYIHYETGQATEPCDNGGGVEYGTYTYNVTTQQLDINNPILDENGCVGLCDDGQGGAFQAIIHGDEITFYENGEEDVSMERVKDDSSPIVASWGLGHYTDLSNTRSEYMSLTFYPNGYYIHWQSDKPSEPDDNGGGVEYGNYTYNATTQQMTINPIFDENGCIGPSEDGQDTQCQVIVGADILTFYYDGVVDCTLERVE